MGFRGSLFPEPLDTDSDEGWEWVTGEIWSETNWRFPPQPDDFMDNEGFTCSETLAIGMIFHATQ
jgi:hypothetical protein